MSSRHALIAAIILASLATTVADAQTAATDRRGERPRPVLRTLPAVEYEAPAATGLFEVMSVRASDGVVRLKAIDGKALDVSVAGHVYDLSKLKPGDKLKVDFFQRDEANQQVSAAGIWPAQ